MSGATLRVDVAVVGGGVVGLAAAAALAERGADVVCIESGRPGGAQSAGLARLLRPYHEYPEMIDESVRAIALWREWEARWSRRLLGSEGVAVTASNLGDAPDRLAAAGVRVIAAPLSREMQPLLADDAGGDPSLFEPAGGVMRARRTIELLVESLGERVHSAHVLALAEPDGFATVLSNEQRVDARHVLVCAGATSASMAASCGIKIPVERDMHVRLAFPIRKPFLEAARDGRLPAWFDDRERFGPSVYGLPLGRTGLYGIGIGGRDGDIPLTPGKAYGSDEEVAGLEGTESALCAYVARTLTGLDPTPVSARRCLVTQLPWGGDHVGVWTSRGGRISFLVGNNLFNLAPLLGERLADIAEGAAVPTWLDPEAHARNAT